MASLSPSEVKIIRKHPLEGLHHLRSALREEIGNGLPVSDEQGFQVPARQKLISLTQQLLTDLCYQAAAAHLNLEHPLNQSLQDLRRKFNYETFRPLIQLVINDAPGTRIWAEVKRVVSVLTRASPPPPPPPPPPPDSYDTCTGTPVSRSTSSYKGSEQTKRNLDRELKYELSSRVYRDVQGFFPKYFDGLFEKSRYKNVLNKIMGCHVKGKWAGIPEPSSQNEFWQWFANLQDKFFSKAPHRFYTTYSTRDIRGSEAKRQLDIFLKNSKQDTLQHNWKDILVVGEHKQTYQSLTELLLQLSRYVRDIFSAQPMRHFVHGFLIHGTIMELWIFDRSGAYSSGEFDINKEPTKFAQAIIGYAFMTTEELGQSTLITRKRKRNSLTIDRDVAGKKRILQLEEDPFIRQRAIICRGTTCYRSSDQSKVVKFSWTSDKRPPESEHLLHAQAKGVEGVASIVGHQHITSIAQLRQGLNFGSPWIIRGGNRSKSSSQSWFSHSFQLLEMHDSVDTGKRKSTDDGFVSVKRRKSSQCSDLRYESNRGTSNSLFDVAQDVYDNRLFGCLAISPAGRSLNDFTSTVELLSAIRDAIRAHRSLVVKAEILHRDISENNIIITNPQQNNGFSGMLIDLDLAKRIGSGRSGARHQTGTMEFMAIEVLRRKAHTIRHEMESFFYVLLWICARRAWERDGPLPEEDVLRGWYRGSFEEIARKKVGDMHTDGFKGILKQFHPSLRSVETLSKNIRGILFPISKDGELETGTPPDAIKLYDLILREFDTAIASETSP